MKESIKFSIIQFGLSALFFLIEYFFVPGAYYGEMLLLIWVYILNIVIGVMFIPLFYLIVSKFSFKRRVGYIFAYFLFVMFIANIIPLISEHILYTGKLVKLIINSRHIQLNLIFELLNPIISFIVAYLLLARSELWLPVTELML